METYKGRGMFEEELEKEGAFGCSRILVVVYMAKLGSSSLVVYKDALGFVESLNLTRRESIGFELCLKFFDTPKPASAAAESNTVAACDQFTAADFGLALCDKLIGYGSQAQKGQFIKVHYVGKLISGKVFDSSYNRSKPLTFCIGVSELTMGKMVVDGGEGDGESFRAKKLMAGGEARENN
nr:peptidyl-prolyl cis-trans isomerase FKBP13, chloroplastic [Tanacetum cinerariifolium]